MLRCWAWFIHWGRIVSWCYSIITGRWHNFNWLLLRLLLISIDLLLEVLKLLYLLLLWIKHILLVQNGVTELSPVHSLSKKSLNSVLNDWLSQNLIDIWSHSLIRVD